MKKTILFALVLLLSLVVEVANADFTFGEPVKFGPVVGDEAIDCFSYDGLEMYFEADRPGGQGAWDLWVLRRASVEEKWSGAAQNLGPAVNSPQKDEFASISADGLTLYFTSTRVGEYGGMDIWMTKRQSKNDVWGQAVNMGPPVCSSANEYNPWISADGLELYFSSSRSGGYGYSDIYVTRRATTNDPWSETENLGPVVNSTYNEVWLSLSPDGLLLLFSESESEPTRPGGYGGHDMWMARRASLSAPWQAPVNLGPMVNGPGGDHIPRISADGRTFYFLSNRDAGHDVWQAPIIPIVDFNGDGIVDPADMCIMVDHWHTGEPLCDIGPMPWGDGIVDVQDLIVFAGYLSPALAAHWALDESEGTVAGDSAGTNDGFVAGDAIWQPDGGQVDGAINLDGVDDFILAAPILNPSEGPFSVFAWVQGGAPGQVVISELMGANWLMLDAEGKLMTELKDSAGLTGPLLSETTITNGEWHRISLVWDGSNRRLCVDDAVVAEDVQDGLVNSYKSLYIGAGKDRQAGTFWDGLIDDVRIYNRALLP
jgi:hypothetical protein